MFSIAPISLISLKLSLGPSVTGTIQWGPKSDRALADQLRELRVPWQKTPSKDIFPLLSWRTQSSHFSGRRSEIEALEDWAKSDYPVRVKFVVGPGGVGKSRLGAEVCERLRGQGWAVGFVDPRKPGAAPVKRTGTLLVVDYPEQCSEALGDWFAGLTNFGLDGKLRVLLLTRQSPEVWDTAIALGNARNIVDSDCLTLKRLDAASAKIIYDTAIERCSSVLQRLAQDGHRPSPISEAAIGAWMDMTSENQLPLFIVAAAAYSAEHPEETVVEYTGREVVMALAQREIERYMRIADEMGLKDEFVLARVLAMAAIAGPITVSRLKSIIAETTIPLGFRADDDVVAGLSTTGLLTDGVVVPPEPDIVAAAFVVETLRKRPDLGPEIVWTCLQDDIAAVLERIARLCWDAEVVLGMGAPCLSDWLAEAVDGNLERCSALDEHFSKGDLPEGWLKAAAEVWRTLLEGERDDNKRARHANNLSIVLDATNDSLGALRAIQEAVEVCRRLAVAVPALYEADLAGSLNNLSSHLGTIGDPKGALRAIEEAVHVYRRLAEAAPDMYEPDLAMSLHNLSNRLDATGDVTAALNAIQEAVSILRRLVEDMPARYEQDLARSLNVLSIRLDENGDVKGALSAIQEAVAIYRRLAEASPARHEPSLARSLNCLSNYLDATGDADGALSAIQEAVAVLRRLATAAHARFESELAISLNNLSNRLYNAGEMASALAVMKEAVAVNRRLVESAPARYESNLAGNLVNLSNCLDATGDSKGAVRATAEAMEVYRRLTVSMPARYEPDLALSLNNLSASLDATGDVKGALSAIQEAVGLYRRLVEATPVRYEPDLARALGIMGRVFVHARRYREAAAFFGEGIGLIQPYAQEYPSSPHERLLNALAEGRREAEAQS